MSDSSEVLNIPRCHYCQRLAPEFYFEYISVCTDCLSQMGGTWRMYRTSWGEISITDADPSSLTDWEYLETGTFEELWIKSLELSGSL